MQSSSNFATHHVDRATDSTRRNGLLLAATLPFALWALIEWSRTIGRIVSYYNRLPVWDYWQVAEHLERYKARDLGVLWIQHNEHRIVFPEIIFAIDMLAFHGRQIFTLATSFLCYFGVWMVLAWTFQSDKAVSPVLRRVGILLAGVIIGWQGCAEVVGSSFLLQWTMLQFAAVATLALLAASSKTSSLVAFIGAIVCGVVATFSSGNGMLLWPVLVTAAFVMRMSRLRVATLALTGAAVIWLYFFRYTSSTDLSVLAIVKHPIYFAGFIASYLSMPFGALGQPQIGVVFGLINLGGFLLLFLVAFRARLLSSPPAVVFFGSFLFILGSAVLTSAGRMNPLDPAFQAAKAVRYVSLPLVNWAVLLLLLLWLSSRKKWELLSPASIVVLSSLCLLGAFSGLKYWLAGNGTFIADQQVATLEVENRVFDPALLEKLYADPGFVTRTLPTLRSNQAAIYSGLQEVSWIGLTLNNVTERCRQTETGRAPQIFPVIGGFEIVGPEPVHRGSSKVVFANKHGKVLGFGEKVSAGTPTVVGGWQATGNKSWIGFISIDNAHQSFSTYVADSHGRGVCLLEPPLELGDARQISMAEAAAPLDGISWDAKNWVKNVLPPDVRAIKIPKDTFWSSWNGSDASTGQLVSSIIALPAKRCIVLSVLHGPSIDGLEIKILDANKGKTLYRVPVKGGEMQWSFWQIPVGGDTNAIQIAADDKGAGWGQWVAVGDPLNCK